MVSLRTQGNKPCTLGQGNYKSHDV
uniref:Uncharacterized protein n=1 Tax=Anguilla anguilla TaxID=7936 RepID=A0A0E9R183_ANGAN